ncbi:MAG: hypothetical protein RIC81_10030 [Microcella pacifica]|uniref:hypothetical protein n=1 Tax=Microcella pacifica TaxID=2591847 RepID=UPI0033149EFC
MTDWSRFLPLSNRPRGDDGEVTRNWARPASGLLLSLANLLETRPESLARETLRPGVSVDDAVRELLTLRRWSGWQRFASRLGAHEIPSPEVAALDADRLAPALRAEAMSLSGATARCSVREFGEILVAALDLGTALEVDLGVDPFASGAVAVDLAVRAPTPRRSVLTARTLVAVDSEWQVGTGPALPATASSIVLFLAGRGGVPPRVDEP